MHPPRRRPQQPRRSRPPRFRRHPDARRLPDPVHRRHGRTLKPWRSTSRHLRRVRPVPGLPASSPGTDAQIEQLKEVEGPTRPRNQQNRIREDSVRRLAPLLAFFVGTLAVRGALLIVAGLLWTRGRRSLATVRRLRILDGLLGALSSIPSAVRNAELADPSSRRNSPMAHD